MISHGLMQPGVKRCLTFGLKTIGVVRNYDYDVAYGLSATALENASVSK